MVTMNDVIDDEDTALSTYHKLIFFGHDLSVKNHGAALYSTDLFVVIQVPYFDVVPVWTTD